mgnify:CR=1 FL=1
MTASILKEKSFNFSLRIIKVYKYLVENKKEFTLSKQLLRSGTAIGALIREAKNAESKMDFIHKLGIAQKECDETLYWLELLFTSGFLANDQYAEAYSMGQEILKMTRSTIVTTKQNLKKSL